MVPRVVISVVYVECVWTTDYVIFHKIEQVWSWSRLNTIFCNFGSWSHNKDINCEQFVHGKSVFHKEWISCICEEVFCPPLGRLNTVPDWTTITQMCQGGGAGCWWLLEIGLKASRQTSVGNCCSSFYAVYCNFINRQSFNSKCDFK